MSRRRLKKYPPLNKEQQELVEEHRWIAGRLAYSAKCLTGGHTGMFTKEDLESVAYFALCVAATRYTPERGIKFSTYAWNTARGYIQHALRDHSRMVRLPRWINEYRYRLRELLKEGTPYEEVLSTLGITEERAILCELSWAEMHASYDHKPEGWREREFIYETDEAKVMLGSPEIMETLRALPDKDLDLLLAYVDDQPLASVERKKAETMLEQLRSIVYDRRPVHRETTPT
jgi:DNA-directed RNA polymerase specialized sigma subunit